MVGQTKKENNRMIEILNFIIGLVFTIAAFIFMIGSAVLVHEKKARYRAGTHDYYDQPIKKENDWVTHMEFNCYNMGICWFACYKRVRKEPFRIGEYYGSRTKY